jgi:hypothetical protein
MNNFHRAGRTGAFSLCDSASLWCNFPSFRTGRRPYTPLSPATRPKTAYPPPNLDSAFRTPNSSLRTWTVFCSNSNARQANPTLSDRNFSRICGSLAFVSSRSFPILSIPSILSKFRAPHLEFFPIQQPIPGSSKQIQANPTTPGIVALLVHAAHVPQHPVIRFSLSPMERVGVRGLRTKSRGDNSLQRVRRPKPNHT